jgi:hypothetical protein
VPDITKARSAKTHWVNIAGIVAYKQKCFNIGCEGKKERSCNSKGERPPYMSGEELANLVTRIAADGRVHTLKTDFWHMRMHQ